MGSIMVRDGGRCENGCIRRPHGCGR